MTKYQYIKYKTYIFFYNIFNKIAENLNIKIRAIKMQTLLGNKKRNIDLLNRVEKLRPITISKLNKKILSK